MVNGNLQNTITSRVRKSITALSNQIGVESLQKAGDQPYHILNEEIQ